MIDRTLMAGLAFPLILLGGSRLGAQEPVRPVLTGVADGDGWTVVNRAATADLEDGKPVVSLDARMGNGAAWLEGVDFTDGAIEVRIRGSNTPGRSFVGIAFHGLDDDTYDAVYFRPFNFVADNALSRSHMVQYISHPDFTWARLRSEHPDIYENALADPPDPDAFFRARIEIDGPRIRVFVNDAADPALDVEALSDRAGGRIGLWVGNGSAGSFSDLVLRPTDDG